jgi:hypothetical protein
VVAAAAVQVVQHSTFSHRSPVWLWVLQVVAAVLLDNVRIRQSLSLLAQHSMFLSEEVVAQADNYLTLMQQMLLYHKRAVLAVVVAAVAQASFDTMEPCPPNWWQLLKVVAVEAVLVPDLRIPQLYFQLVLVVEVETEVIRL